MCRSQTVAYVGNKLTPLDSANRLLPASDSANITDYAGIAYRRDLGDFMAVQEHYPRNTSRWGGAPATRTRFLEGLPSRVPLLLPDIRGCRMCEELKHLCCDCTYNNMCFGRPAPPT